MLDPYLIEKFIFVTSISIFSVVTGLLGFIFVSECYNPDKGNGVVIQLLIHFNRDEMIITKMDLARFKFGLGKNQRPSREQQEQARYDLRNALLYGIDGYRASRLKDRNHFACLFTRREM